MTGVHRARLRGPGLQRYPAPDLLVTVLAAAFPLLLLVPTGILDPPPTVPRFSVANPTVFDITVDVGAPGRDTWLPVLGVEPWAEAWTTDVVDQGAVWRIRFRSAGQEGGELVLTRTDLDTAGWQVTVPAPVSERLDALGVPPAP